MNQCPPQERLQQWLAAEQSQSGFQSIEEHLEGCPHCQQAVEQLQKTPNASDWRRRLDGMLAAPDISFPPSPVEGFIGRVDRYDIKEKLGSGMMGSVFRAYDHRLKRWVALKVIRPELAASPVFRKVFDREARAAAAVENDHAVTILQVETGAPGFNLPFLAMELIEGEALEKRLKRKGKLPPREGATIAYQIALGLAATHAAGLVHRDVKPSNVLLDAKSKRAKITDFGLARAVENLDDRVTRTGGAPGSPAYMSPEQSESPASIDGRSDLFSLGVVLYEMLTGERPFTGATPVAVAERVKHHQPPDPRKLDKSISPDLETICLVCLDKDPGHRFQNANALADDLRRFLKNEAIQCRRPSLRRRALLFTRRNRVLMRATAGFLLVMLLWGTWSLLALSSANSLIDTKTKLADEKGKEADARKLLEQQTRYFTDVKGAWKAWENNRLGEARTLLAKHVPGGDADVRDFRGFEWYYLDRLLSSSFRTFPFDGSARAARFSPGEDRLAVIGTGKDGQNRINLFRLDTGKSEHTLTLGKTRSTGSLLGHYIPLHGDLAGDQGVAYSPDGRLVAGTCHLIPKPNQPRGVVKVWEVATGREVFSAEDEAVAGLSVAFSPDGKTILAGGYNHAAFAWNLESRALRWTLPAFDPTRGGQVARAVPQTTTTMIDQPVVGLRFGPDGKSLSRSTPLRGDGRDTTRKTVTSAWPPDDKTSAGPAMDFDVAVSPEGRQAVTTDAAHATISLVAPSQGKPRSRIGIMNTKAEAPKTASSVRFESGRITSVALGKVHFALAGEEGGVTFGAIDPNQPAFGDPTHLKGHSGSVTSLAFSSDETRLAAAGPDAVTVWSLTFRTESQPLADALPPEENGPSERRLWPPNSTPDGRWLYYVEDHPASREAQSIAIFEPAHPETRVARFRSPVKKISALAISPDGSRCAISGDDARIGNVLKRYAASNGSRPPRPTEKDLDPNVAIHIVDIRNDRTTQTLKGPQHEAWSLSFHPDNKRLVSAAGAEPAVWLWDTEAGKELRRFEWGTAKGRRAAFSLDGKWIVSAATDGKLTLWNLDKAEARTLPDNPVWGVPVWAFYSEKGQNLLAFLENEKSIHLWDMDKGRMVFDLNILGRKIEAMAFLGHGSRLITEGDYTTMLWSLETGQDILPLPHDVWQKQRLPLFAAQLDGFEQRWKRLVQPPVPK